MPNTQNSVAAKNDVDLDALLADMGIGSDEIIEQVEETIVPGEFSLEEAAVKSLENAEALQEHYESESTPEVTDAVPPTAATEKKAKGKKGKKAKPVVEGDEPTEKAPKAVRKLYTSKVERITDKFGAELDNNTVLTLADAALTGAELEAKQKETLEIISKAGIKVQNRMTLLLEFVGGKSSKLNEVITRAFAILKKDGFIRSGEKGNFHIDLMTKYSVASARAMGNNTLACLRDLRVIEKNADGAYVLNDDSLIAVRANALLGL